MIYKYLTVIIVLCLLCETFSISSSSRPEFYKYPSCRCIVQYQRGEITNLRLLANPLRHIIIIYTVGLYCAYKVWGPIRANQKPLNRSKTDNIMAKRKRTNNDLQNWRDEYHRHHQKSGGETRCPRIVSSLCLWCDNNRIYPVKKIVSDRRKENIYMKGKRFIAIWEINIS
jgi:hypothetical protein